MVPFVLVVGVFTLAFYQRGKVICNKNFKIMFRGN